MSKERQATAAEFMGLKPYPEREETAAPKPRAGEHTSHDDKMLIFALREENDELRSQVAFLERFADAPDIGNGKTTRDLLREREKVLVATLLDIARDCEAIAEDERDAGYKGTFASIASQARGVLAKARP